MPRPNRPFLSRIAHRPRATPTVLPLIALLTLLCSPIEARAGEIESPFGDLQQALNPSNPNLEDRLAILNLLHAYSHLADGLMTEAFGTFFTETALFEVVPPSTTGAVVRQRMGKGRKAIVAALAPRHAKFRREGIQRRHFLTNPVVWDQTDRQARVAVYLQLRSSQQGGPSQLISTGRYEGLAIKTLEGWRMSEWTVYPDQMLE